jgi:hypothetical protein
LFNAIYSPSHRQASTPMINIHSTLRTAIDFAKMLHSQCYFVRMVIHIQSVSSQICVYMYVYIFHNIETLTGRRIKNGTALNSACQGNLSACDFGYSCHRFVSPAVGGMVAQAAAYSGMSASSCMCGEAAVSIPPVHGVVVYVSGTLISVWLLLSWL